MAARKGKAVEIDGIKLDVLVDTADDYELVEQMAVMSDDQATGNEKLAATVRTYRLLLGDDYRRVKDELRAKNSGRLPLKAMSDFIAKVVEAAGAKN